MSAASELVCVYCLWLSFTEDATVFTEGLKLQLTRAQKRHHWHMRFKSPSFPQDQKSELFIVIFDV